MKYTKIYIILLFLTQFFLVNCVTLGSTVQFKEHKNFWNWMIGDIIVLNKNVSKENLKSHFGQCLYKFKRHPYYLWFRTPEIFLNPDSFKNYAMFSNCEKYLYNNCDFFKNPKDQPNCNLPPCCQENILKISTDFSIVTGITDYLVLTSASALTTSEDTCLPTKCAPTIGFACLVPYHFIYNLVSNMFKMVVYIPHDIIKTAVLPVAGVYYATKKEENQK